jgi:hypothetical protein
MNRFELWFVRRVLRREVRQDFDHDKKIAALYGLIRQACKDEFTEDNAPTLSSNLSEWFETTQVWAFGEPHDIALNVRHKDCHKAAEKKGYDKGLHDAEVAMRTQQRDIRAAIHEAEGYLCLLCGAHGIHKCPNS